MKKATLLTTVFLLILSLQIFAVQDYSNGITTSENIYKAAKYLNSKDYPNANSITVNDQTVESYKPDGTDESWNDFSVKIFTEKGRRANRTQSIPYSANYSNVTLTLAEIIKPDGSVKQIDLSKQSRTAIDSGQMGSNIYDPNNKVLTLNFPDLKIGDTVRLVSHSKSFKTPMPNTWANLVTFEGTSPIHYQSYTLIAPHALPLQKTTILNPVGKTLTYKKTEEMTGIKYEWIAKNVPRMFPEPQMPEQSYVVQRVDMSTIPSWKTISKWYWNLCKPHMQATPAMKEKIQELIKGAKTDKAKITNIYNFVSQKVRYMGLIAEKDSPGFEPHDVKLTFDNRYGVCRDKAVLLVEMLRIAGYKAYPVIIKVGTKLDKEVPMIWFNHAITCVVLNGKDILMDPTNENTKDIFPAYLGNCSYIVADPEGVTLKTSPVIPADKNMMDINTTGELTPKGVLDATTIINCHGINDTLMRNILSRQTPAQIKELFDQIFRYIIPSSKIKTLEITPENLMNTDQNVKIKISYTSDNDLVKGRKNAMLSLNWIGKSFGFVGQIVRATGLEKRKYPLITSFTCGYNEKINIKLQDPDLKLDYTPKYNSISSDIVSYTQNVKVENNNLLGTGSLKINSVEFSPKQYLELKKDLKQLEVDKKKKIIFNVNDSKENKVKTDSEILNQTVNITLKNSHSWTEKYNIERKILTYNGKKDFSEIKIPYNPAIEDVKIDSAEVISKTGKVNKLTKDEINIMDAGWNSSAPRYPEGKILIANLPSVEVGSTIKYSFTHTVKNKPFFSDVFTFQGFSPIKQLTYTINYPKDLIVNIFKTRAYTVSDITTFENNITTQTLKAKNIPAIKKVDSLPPAWTFQPTFIESTGNWADYTKLLIDNFSKAVENQPNTEKITQRLIKGKNSAKEKITAIRDFVAKNIRSAGPNFTSLPLTAISNADTTLEDSYGNNSDKAVLLYSMLKSVGFKPDFIFASEMPYLKDIYDSLEITPLEGFLSDILVKVKISDKESVYLNDTNEYAILGATAHQDCVGYDPVTEKFFKIEANKNKSDNMKIYYNLSVTSDGSAELKVTKKYYGNIYAGQKEMFDKMRPEDRSRYYQRRIANISQAATPSSKLYTNFKRYPGIEKYSAKIANYSILESNYCYFTLPLMLNFVLNLDADKRELPFFMTDSQNLEFYITTELPKDFPNYMIYPKSQSFVLPNNSGNISMNSNKTDNTTFYNEILIKTKPSIYSPEAYNEALRLNKQISSPETKTFLLEKAK